jgi:hypothetical protein
MKPEPLKPIPFLKEQQELSAMFEPEKIAHYFQMVATDTQIDLVVNALYGQTEEEMKRVGG